MELTGRQIDTWIQREPMEIDEEGQAEMDRIFASNMAEEMTQTRDWASFMLRI